MHFTKKGNNNSFLDKYLLSYDVYMQFSALVNQVEAASRSSSEIDIGTNLWKESWNRDTSSHRWKS